jgi:alkyl hydroperoxide reductase subunit AhpF
MLMAFLDDSTRDQVVKVLEGMDAPVRLVSFTQSFECDSCHDARALVEELASLSGKLSHEVYDLVEQKEKAAEYGIDKVPATIVASDGNHRLRFYGVPGGYEFAVLLEDIVMLSRGDSGLSQESREKLRSIKAPVHLQVLVTPT